MKISIASFGDPSSISTWSGIPAHILLALKRNQHEVSTINLIKPIEPWYYNWYRRIFYRLQKKWFLSEVEPWVLQQIGKQFDEEVGKIQPDLVIVIHGDFLAYTTFSQPAIIVHDATFASLLEYYPAFSNLTNRSINSGNMMYQAALNRAVAAVYSSKWASESAIVDYGIDSEKIFTIPFGANLSQAPENENVMEWISKRSKGEICNFLFLGVDWDRKGGPDALRFVVELNHLGIKSQLLIAGCTPQIEPRYEKFIQQLGFLRKDIKEEAEKLENLLINSHALLLPSVAECYGCVYCEANAYGLPAIGRDTGGVSEIIKDGVNGLLMKGSETPEELAKRWVEIWLDRVHFVQLSQSARNEYLTRLNYEIFIEKLEHIVSTVVNTECENLILEK